MVEQHTSPTAARRRTSRRLVLAIVMVALAAIGYYLSQRDFFAGKQSARNEAPPHQAGKVVVELDESQVAALRFGTAGLARFDVLLTAVGNIDFNENLLVQVFTPYQGRIISTFANVGDRVSKGQPLFTIDSPDLLSAESNLIAAAGVLDLQNANLKRLTETLRTGGGAQKDVDQTTSDQMTAEGNLRTARDAVRIFGKSDAEIDQIVKNRKADPVLVVPTPISGLITQRTAAPGLLVQPGNVPAPFNVADTSTMWMLANVVESEAPLLRVNQPVKVKVAAYPDREFDGVITVVGSIVDPNTRRVMMRSEIEDPLGLLRSGMFANFTISVGEPFEAVAVPDNAVVREGDGTMSVWLTTDRRRIEKRSVKVGRSQKGFTEILEGLRPGEQIVFNGAIFVSNQAIISETVLPD